MSLNHYTAEEIAAAREDYPGHVLVEVATPRAACLIAIPDTPENRDKPIANMPGMTIDLLDGNTIMSHGRMPQENAT